MPRKPRFQLPPRLRSFKCRQVYHVYQRGSQRQRVFDTKAQIVFYLDRLDLLARRYKVRIHAFCIMSNHVHFMFEPLRKGAISRLMQHLQSQYARLVNGLRRTEGHLWRNHFHAKHVTSPGQYRSTLLYIEQNPVAAGLCGKAHLYPYSSAVAHTQNQPVYTLARHEREAQVRLHLDRWRHEFDLPQTGDTNWATWLRSPREAAHQQDLAAFDEVRSIEGKPLPLVSRPVALPPAQARALTAPESIALRYFTARGS